MREKSCDYVMIHCFQDKELHISHKGDSVHCALQTLATENRFPADKYQNIFDSRINKSQQKFEIQIAKNSKTKKLRRYNASG